MKKWSFGNQGHSKEIFSVLFYCPEWARERRLVVENIKRGKIRNQLLLKGNYFLIGKCLISWFQGLEMNQVRPDV